jgi:putative tributyrin esterase
MRKSPLVLFALLASSWAIGGELEVKELASRALDQSVKVNVLLPDGYKDDSSKRYPVIYLLHGYGGDYQEWEKIGIVGEAAKLPVILVMPEGDKSFYVNHHDNPKARWEEYITKELVELTDKTYRTMADREHRGISGLSMGGYGAITLGLRHPELYSSAASHSGALGILATAPSGDFAEQMRKIFGPDDAKERQDYDPFALAKGLAPEQRPHIYIDCGSSDFLLESSRKFIAHLSSLHVDYEYREVPGAHTHAYWKANVRYSLTRQLEAMERPPVAKKPAAPPAAPGSTTIAGTWSLILKILDGERDYDLRVEDAAGALKAVLVSPRSGEHPVKAITFKEGAIHVEIERDIQGQNATFVFDGKLDGAKLSGKVAIKESPDIQGEWTAEKKQAVKL